MTAVSTRPSIPTPTVKSTQAQRKQYCVYVYANSTYDSGTPQMPASRTSRAHHGCHRS